MTLVTLDTNVVLAGLRSTRGASHRILQLIQEGRVKPSISVALFLEYEEVLSRPEHLVATGLSRGDVEDFLLALVALGEQVTRIPYRWRPILSDPDDDMVVECAVFSGSEFLVTMNERDFRVVSGRFRFELVGPGKLVRLLEG